MPVLNIKREIESQKLKVEKLVYQWIEEDIIFHLMCNVL